MSHPPAAGQGGGAPCRLLLVDDEPDILETVQALLESTFEGLQVVPANSGQEALPLLQQRGFDLMVTDYRMPGMDGADLANHAHRLHPSMPVLMLTAYVDTKTLADLNQRAPGLDILPKPIDIDPFLAKVADWLRSCLDPKGRPA